MRALNRKLEKKHYGNSIMDALKLVIPAVILTADDILRCGYETER